MSRRNGNGNGGAADPAPGGNNGAPDPPPPGNNGGAAGGANNAQPSAQEMMAMVLQLAQAQQAMAQAIQANGQAQQATAATALKVQQRTAAGHVPQFAGKKVNIDVALWIKAMERYFAAANVGENEHQERIAIAVAALSDTAGQWWTGQLSEFKANPNGRLTVFAMWAEFATSISQRFMPVDEQRWAMDEMATLTSHRHRQVEEFTKQFDILHEVLTQASMTEMSRLQAYENGLPQEYAVKSRGKGHKTYKEAKDAALHRWRAECQARQTPRMQDVNNMGDATEEDAASDHYGGSSGSSGTQPGGRPTAASAPAPNTWPSNGPAGGLLSVDQLNALLDARLGMVQKQANLASNRSGGGGRGGGNRGRGRGNRGGGGRAASPGRVGDKRPTIPPEVWEARREKDLCGRCGGTGHYARGCRNESNTDMPKN